jgi:hypothetical protein
MQTLLDVTLYVHCLSFVVVVVVVGVEGKRRKGLKIICSLVNGTATKHFQKHSHFTRTSTNAVTRQLQTAKRKHSGEYNRHHIQLVLPSVIAQMFYAIYDIFYVGTKVTNVT